MLRGPSKSKHEATTACTMDTLGSMQTVPGATPRTLPTRSPRLRTAGSQCSPHDAIESFSHSSMNRVAYPRAAAGIAPSEWLMR